MLCFIKPLLLSLLHLLTISASSSNGQLMVGFYSNSCPPVEQVVRNAVQQFNAADPKTAARLLRLSFHDCFVEGCDGSILLDGGERKALGNSGLMGFDVIETAKQRLENACPGVVSCADILALAARDAVALSDGPNYNVLTGRRDGRVSSTAIAAAELPDVDDSIEALSFKFSKKGLSVKDLVLLSVGGHTIGTTACFFMTHRLYNFSSRSSSDPRIQPQFLPQLKSGCPFGGNVNARVPLDWNSVIRFDDHIIRNIVNGLAVLASDATLTDDRQAVSIMQSYLEAGNPASFMNDFADAMVKMGNIGVKTGMQGEIRRRCNVVN